MPGDGDDHARAASSRVALGQQTMEAGDADVVQPVDVVAHDLGRDRRLLGDGYVRSSCRGDQNDTLAASAPATRRSMIRACSWNRASGTTFATAANAAASVRVTSSA